jgi:hypothetical protein
MYLQEPFASIHALGCPGARILVDNLTVSLIALFFIGPHQNPHTLKDQNEPRVRLQNLPMIYHVLLLQSTSEPIATTGWLPLPSGKKPGRPSKVLEYFEMQKTDSHD